jgi:hypothetical protein
MRQTSGATVAASVGDVRVTTELAFHQCLPTAALYIAQLNCTESWCQMLLSLSDSKHTLQLGLLPKNRVPKFDLYYLMDGNQFWHLQLRKLSPKRMTNASAKENEFVMRFNNISFRAVTNRSQ